MTENLTEIMDLDHDNDGTRCHFNTHRFKLSSIFVEGGVQNLVTT